jgi:hypothetical protein
VLPIRQMQRVVKSSAFGWLGVPFLRVWSCVWNLEILCLRTAQSNACAPSFGTVQYNQ